MDITLDADAIKPLTYPEMLEQLLGAEVAARSKRNLTTSTKLVHFPFQRTLERFDFGFQLSIDERLIKELANLAFVSEAIDTVLQASGKGPSPDLYITCSTKPGDCPLDALGKAAGNIIGPLERRRKERLDSLGPNPDCAGQRSPNRNVAVNTAERLAG